MLENKVRFLSKPTSYPHRPDQVIVKETHMSWVFLAGEKVFKLKKPVRYPYLDFTTLEAREFYCGEEFRLNRRLAPGIYKRIVPLTCSSSGDLVLDGEGEIIDWLIEMQRLPANCMLDTRLKEKSVNIGDMERIADVLANFYRTAEHPSIDSQAPFYHFMSEMADNRVVLMRPDLLPDQFRVSAILNEVDAAIQKARDRLKERAGAGHIVDGHGDLRPEHICLIDPIVIFDSLEFNRELRLVDPFDEMAFLSMECAHLGEPWFGSALMERVARLLGEDAPNDLIPIYITLHAVLRARLSLAHLLDPVPREPAKWVPLAREYLDLAEQALGSDRM
jgi:aminoglycoside phosphotransferase family enzyme